MSSLSTRKQSGSSFKSSLVGAVTCGVLAYCTYSLYLRSSKSNARNKRKNEWKNKNIARISDLNLKEIMELFDESLRMERIVLQNGGTNTANGRVLATVFYEPSTRTSCSFQAAMLRLGGSVINPNISKSSVKKGETLQDTFRCLECYSDVIVVRHPEIGTPDKVIQACPNTPILNAGDGSGEHPTQALLDLFTIYKCLNNKINGLTVTFVGDLKYGRTVHSLAIALTYFKDITINFVSPQSLCVPKYIIDKLGNVNVCENRELNDTILGNTDVLYVTRIQKERFSSLNDYEIVKNAFVINKDLMKKCKDNMIVMHPLPRVDEISVEVDSDERAVYFKQMRYGMYVRMAILSLVLGLN